LADYLVTGAAGFIASRVAEMLLEAGHHVTGVDNLNDAYDVRMKAYRLQRLQALPGFTFARLDIADRQALESAPVLAAPRFEAVINLAARAGVRASLKDPWIFYETNVNGSLNLLELCRQRGIGKFIQASTSTVYGLKAPVPTPESAETDHPPQAYAASKKAAEVLCACYHSLYDLDISVVRYFTVYGPAGRPDMSMFRFARWLVEEEPIQLYGSGEQSRGFTYLDDIARGTIAALKPLGYEIFNLGGHEVISMNALIAMMEAATGIKAIVERHPANPGELLTNQADVNKARTMLGWEPQVGLQEGVRRLLEWYAQERGWAKEIALS
jgi:nucleoside-diphosphate-sugar epimerase